MKLKIIANPKKPWAVALARELAPFLKEAGHHVVRSGADATVCIGGDGTILYSNHRDRLEGAILGIGGDKSYICQIHNNDWKRKVLPALEGGRKGIMTLECAIGGERSVALNDVVIHATHYRVAEMDISVSSGGKERKTQFEGDGMIVSTPMGSTGYAYSAGGDKLRPSERKISLVPICPYKRAFSPNILPEDGRVEITVGNDCAFITDGIFVRRLKRGETACVKRGPDMVFFEGVGTWE